MIKTLLISINTVGLISNFINQISNGAYNLLSFALIISIVVFVHEYGHYIFAKAFKVKVESFSIGFGPEIFGFYDKSKTRWKLSSIPLGGYVKMLGDDNVGSILSTQQELTEERKLYSLNLKPRYKKAVIVFAGPLANMVLAVIAFTVFFSTVGYHYYTPPVVESIIEGSAAEKAGLLPGDIITQINEFKIRYFGDISRVVTSITDEKMEINYIRNKEKHKVTITPSIIKGSSNSLIGRVIGINSTNMARLKQSSFIVAVNMSVSETYQTMYLTIRALFQILVGKRSLNEIGGPIKIAKYSGQSAKGGFGMVLYFIAIISATLAAVNLLPIPLLDGGHLFNYLIEAIIRRNLGPMYHKYATIFGITILVLLMVIAIVNDIKNLFKV